MLSRLAEALLFALAVALCALAAVEYALAVEHFRQGNLVATATLGADAVVAVVFAFALVPKKDDPADRSGSQNWRRDA